MKKNFLFLFSILFLFFLVSCEKENSSPDGVNELYKWSGVNPKPISYLGKESTSIANVYDYYFKVHLDGSQINPAPFDLSTFGIPHVGPGGSTIYDNVENDATYTITKIEGAYLYYTIRSQVGNNLKYNLAKWNGTKWIWFLCHGLSNDDNNSNMIIFTTN